MAYAVSKAAGLHLMKCLAQTQGSKVRVNAVLPGLLLTDWVSCLQDMVSRADQTGPTIPARESQGL